MNFAAVKALEWPKVGLGGPGYYSFPGLETCNVEARWLQDKAILQRAQGGPHPSWSDLCPS